MTPASNDSWVRRFVVSDPKKHKKGFTVYKVSSIVYQKDSPEAGTKVVVWKRYNDFKKLHRELLEQYKKLYHKGDFPAFAKAKFFGRFEEEVVEERRKCARMLLDFVGSHPLLFTSSTFVKFFETGHTLHGWSEGGPLSDGKGACSGVEPIVVSADELVPEPACRCPSPQGCLTQSSQGSLSDGDSVGSSPSLSPSLSPSPPAQAVAGCCDTLGCVARAAMDSGDAPARPRTDEHACTLSAGACACPLPGLHCYKVLGLIGRLMLVHNTVDSRRYVMKVLHKSSCPVQPRRQRVLPVAVPYLVPLQCYFETDTTVFLVLEHVRCNRRSATVLRCLILCREVNNIKQLRAGRLWDSVRGCTPQPGAASMDTAELLRKAQRLLSSVCDTLHRAERAVPSLQRRCSSDLSLRAQELPGPALAPATPIVAEGQVRRWAAQLVLCLEGLHRCGLVYRDLRPDNVLLGADSMALLSFTCSWPAVEQMASAQAVRQLYAAPEVTSIFEATPAADWWSLGALLFELITGQALSSSQPGGLHSHSILSFPKHVSPEAQSLLTELLRYHPQERLGAGTAGVAELKSHPFFCGVEWPEVEAAGLQAGLLSRG